jgi:hypothetical protein
MFYDNNRSGKFRAEAHRRSFTNNPGLKAGVKCKDINKGFSPDKRTLVNYSPGEDHGG